MTTSFVVFMLSPAKPMDKLSMLEVKGAKMTGYKTQRSNKSGLLDDDQPPKKKKKSSESLRALMRKYKDDQGLIEYLEGIAWEGLRFSKSQLLGTYDKESAMSIAQKNNRFILIEYLIKEYPDYKLDSFAAPYIVANPFFIEKSRHANTDLLNNNNNNSIEEILVQDHDNNDYVLESCSLSNIIELISYSGAIEQAKRGNFSLLDDLLSDECHDINETYELNYQQGITPFYHALITGSNRVITQFYPHLDRINLNQKTVDYCFKNGLFEVLMQIVAHQKNRRMLFSNGDSLLMKACAYQKKYQKKDERYKRLYEGFTKLVKNLEQYPGDALYVEAEHIAQSSLTNYSLLLNDFTIDQLDIFIQNPKFRKIDRILYRFINYAVALDKEKNSDAVAGKIKRTELFGHELLRKLLAYDDVDVNAYECLGMPPLFYAIEFDHIFVFEILLEQKAINVNATHKTFRIWEKNATPLTLVIRDEKTYMLEMLLKNPNIDLSPLSTRIGFYGRDGMHTDFERIEIQNGRDCRPQDKKPPYHKKLYLTIGDLFGDLYSNLNAEYQNFNSQSIPKKIKIRNIINVKLNNELIKLRQEYFKTEAGIPLYQRYNELVNGHKNLLEQIAKLDEELKRAADDHERSRLTQLRRKAVQDNNKNYNKYLLTVKTLDKPLIRKILNQKQMMKG